MAKRILLGSGGFRTSIRLRFLRSEVDSFLGDIDRVLFIPYAMADHAGYLKKTRDREIVGSRTLTGIHTLKDPRKAVREAKALFVGGGNTFRLLKSLYDQRLIDVVRKRVAEGMPYIGVSAGSNVAGLSIRTTNDMPITYPPKLDALAIVPVQLNPHYFSGAFFFKSGAKYVRYAGETRDDRIREFHEMNRVPVLGIWEGTILRIEGRKMTLKGVEGVGGRLFERGKPPKNVRPGADLSALL